MKYGNYLEPFFGERKLEAIYVYLLFVDSVRYLMYNIVTG